MEDDLKTSKVEYLSNHLLDHTQILNLSFSDQTKFINFFKWRQPWAEDDLKILKVEYISTPDKIFLKYYILAKGTKSKLNFALNEDDHIS